MGALCGKESKPHPFDAPGRSLHNPSATPAATISSSNAKAKAKAKVPSQAQGRVLGVSSSGGDTPGTAAAKAAEVQHV
jgi:hypothetical protein